MPGREPDLKTTGGLMYYQTDARRTVTEITDRQGGVVDRYRYDAFGGLFTGITAPYNTMGLTGHQYDAKTGLVDMNARWYAPTTGRFLTPDTWPGTVTDPWTQNPYVYVGNNPMTNWDPSGHCPDPMGVSYCADDSGGNTATFYFLEGKGSSSSYQTIKTWSDLLGNYAQYAWSELDWWKYEVMDVTWTDRSKGQGSWTTSDQTFSQVAAGSGVSFTPYANPQQKEAAAGPARNSAAGPLPKEVIAEQKLVYQSWNPGVVQVMQTPTVGGSPAASALVEGFVNKAMTFGKTIASDTGVQKDISQFEAEKGIPKGTLDGGSAAQILAAYAAGISSVQHKLDAAPTPGPLFAYTGGAAPSGPLTNNLLLGVLAHLLIEANLLQKANEQGLMGDAEHVIWLITKYFGEEIKVPAGIADFVLLNPVNPDQVLEVYEIKPSTYDQNPGLAAIARGQLGSYLFLTGAVPGTTLTPDTVLPQVGNGLFNLTLSTYTKPEWPGMIYYNWQAEGTLPETVKEFNTALRGIISGLVAIELKFLWDRMKPRLAPQF